MELRVPPRTALAGDQPLAETTVGISDSHGALAKADRYEITYVSVREQVESSESFVIQM
jgi:hypothetical protein